MTKTNNLIKEVFKDFNGEVGKRVKILTFLDKISKSKVFISKKTGTIYHSPNIKIDDPKKVVKFLKKWKKISNLLKNENF